MRLEGRTGSFFNTYSKETHDMAGKAKKAGKGGNLVVGSKVKDVIRSSGVRAAGDLVDAVSSSVGGMLKKAIERCKANGRGTVRPQDL